LAAEVDNLMGERRLIEHLAPWLGLVAAGLGWGLAHQVASNSVFDDCRVGEGWFVLLVCLVGLLITAGGAWYSYDVWRQGEKETEGRRFLGLLGTFLAALAAFAIILQAASSLILPRCIA
jgi:hypothetical protein